MGVGAGLSEWREASGVEVAAHVHNYLPCGCLIMWELLSSW